MDQRGVGVAAAGAAQRARAACASRRKTGAGEATWLSGDLARARSRLTERVSASVIGRRATACWLS